MRTSAGIVYFALVTAMPLTAHAEITTRLVPSLGIAIGVTTDLTFGVFGGGDFEVELSDYSAIAAQARGALRLTPQGAFLEPTFGFCGGLVARGARLVTAGVRAGPSWQSRGTIGVGFAGGVVFFGGLGLEGWARRGNSETTVGFDFSIDFGGLVTFAYHWFSMMSHD